MPRSKRARSLSLSAPDSCHPRVNYPFSSYTHPFLTPLVPILCGVCAQVSTKSTQHLFLDLPGLTDKLTQFIDTSSKKGQWSANSIQVTNSWIRDGLKTRCITRDLKWGTPVPAKGFEDKVFYVWFDAPIGYLSITASYTDEWEQWWKNPEEVELVQFMGKDNIPFHTVIFPCSLIGSQEKYTMLHHISTTEYLNYEGGKFSKSRGVGVFGNDAKSTGIPSEVWRYYLLYNRPEASDTVFTWTDFAAKNNNELLANLGNFVNRILSFLTSRFQGVVPPYSAAGDAAFIAQVQELMTAYVSQLDNYKIKQALQTAMAVSKLGNQFMQVPNRTTTHAHMRTLTCSTHLTHPSSSVLPGERPVGAVQAGPGPLRAGAGCVCQPGLQHRHPDRALHALRHRQNLPAAELPPARGGAGG